MGQRGDEGPSGQLGMGLVTLIMKGGWSCIWLAHGSCLLKGLLLVVVWRSGCPGLCQQKRSHWAEHWDLPQGKSRGNEKLAERVGGPGVELWGQPMMPPTMRYLL